METRQKFNEQMREVYQNVLRMGAAVEEALCKSLQAMKDHDLALAEQVIRGDVAIDAWQSRIEDLCIIILATEQPVARDLRELVTIIKIVADLERVGDHARHFAKAVKNVREAVMAKVIDRVAVMAEKDIHMFHTALSAISEKDPAKAREVAMLDSEIDALHKDLFQHILALMKSNPDEIEEATTLLNLNRFLERLGDHVTNICEWIVYARTGEHAVLND